MTASSPTTHFWIVSLSESGESLIYEADAINAVDPGTASRPIVQWPARQPHIGSRVIRTQIKVNGVVSIVDQSIIANHEQPFLERALRNDSYHPVLTISPEGYYQMRPTVLEWWSNLARTERLPKDNGQPQGV